MAEVKNAARVKGLRRISIATSDLQQSTAFYENTLGFKIRSTEPHAAFLDFGRRTIGELHLHHEAKNAMTRLSFEVTTRDELEAILGRLRASGVRILGGRSSDALGDDYAVEVADPDGNTIELVVPAPGASIDYTNAGARRLGHVVLWTPDTANMERFLELIGLRVSDRTHLGMSFLRCNGDHHTVGLARSSVGRSGMQHVAFDIGTEDSVAAEQQRLAESGVNCIWGLGRHGPGNNIFSYYLDPGRNVFEFYGDMERVTDLDPAPARYWGTEHRGDISGRAGPPPAPFHS